jgi:glycosyltransferase involved in cell wall biosynthesis
MMVRDPTLSVVIPVYNEQATVELAIRRLLDTELPARIEVIVVDDGSEDGSAESIASLVEAEQIRLIQHERNRGKGAAVRTGINAARGEFLTVLDADLEYEPHNYAGLLEVVVAGDASAAYGSRSFGAHTAFSFWYVIGNRILSFWASFLFDTWLSDIETCFKVAPTETWRSLDLRSDDFGIEAEFTGKLLRDKKSIFEMPIAYKARPREEGKKLVWTDGVKAMWILLRIRLFRR